VTGKLVSVVKKIFSFAEVVVSGIESMASVMHTIFRTTETAVTAAKKILAVTPTTSCVN